jgi:transposase
VKIYESEERISKAIWLVTEALSINQAAIHYHLPYSSLYGRINRYVNRQ